MKYIDINWINKNLVSNRPISKVHFMKLALGLFILICLASHSPLDPSPFNLLSPVSGINNWFGLPGALFSGLLFDFLGPMAFLIPGFVLLFTRQKSTLHPKHLLPDFLEILAFVALVSILFPKDAPAGIQIAGVWGYLSAQAISHFPGELYAVLILFCYQLVYFKNIRLDLSLFTVSWTAILLISGILSYILNNMVKTFNKSAKYSSVNWISPLTLLIAKSTEKTQGYLKSKYLFTKRKLEDANLEDRVFSAVEKAFGKKENSNNILKDLKSGRKEFEKQMLSQVIKKYRKTLYVSDSKTFLKLEEEI